MLYFDTMNPKKFKNKVIFSYEDSIELESSDIHLLKGLGWEK